MPYYVVQLQKGEKQPTIIGSMPRLENGVNLIDLMESRFSIFIEGDIIQIFLTRVDLNIVFMTEDEGLTMDDLMSCGVPHLIFSPHLKSSFASMVELINNAQPDAEKYLALRWYRKEVDFSN